MILRMSVGHHNNRQWFYLLNTQVHPVICASRASFQFGDLYTIVTQQLRHAPFGKRLLCAVAVYVLLGTSVAFCSVSSGNMNLGSDGRRMCLPPIISAGISGGAGTSVGSPFVTTTFMEPSDLMMLANGSPCVGGPSGFSKARWSYINILAVWTSGARRYHIHLIPADLNAIANWFANQCASGSASQTRLTTSSLPRKPWIISHCSRLIVRGFNWDSSLARAWRSCSESLFASAARSSAPATRSFRLSVGFPARDDGSTDDDVFCS